MALATFSLRPLAPRPARCLAVLLAAAAGAAAQTYYWNPAPGGLAEAQRASNWTAKADGTGLRAPSDRDDDFTADALGPAWTFRSVDNVPATGTSSLTAFPDRLQITGRGDDVYLGTNEYTGVYRSDITGDFDVTVKVDSCQRQHDATKAGIYMADDFTNLGAGGFAGVAWRGDRKVEFQFDNADTVGQMDPGVTTGSVSSLSGPVWLRLLKKGSSVSGYYRNSPDSAWIRVGTPQTILSTAANSQIALIYFSHSANTGTAIFDDFHGGGSLASSALDLRFGGTGPRADTLAALGADLAAKSIDFTGYAGTFSFSTWNLALTGDATFSPAMAVNPGTGRITLAGTGTQTLTPKSNDTLPQIRKTGTDTAVLAGPLAADSLHLSAGTWDFNGHDMVLKGNLRVDGGAFANLGGRTLTVGGNASLSGTSGHILRLDPAAAWSIKVAGSFTADHVQVARSDASGGSPGAAASVAADLGGNLNWSFGGGPPTTLPAIAREPRDTTVTVGGTAVFSASAAGNPAPAYQWRRVGDTTLLSSDSVLTVAAASSALDGARYQCVATNSLGRDSSRIAVLTVLPLPVPAAIIREPADASVAAGRRAVFSADVAGSAPVAYQWRRKGDTAVLSTDSLYVIPAASEAQNGWLLYVVVSNAAGRDTSREARLSVGICDSLAVQAAGDTAVDEGAAFALSGKAVCAERYEWTVLSGPAPRLLDPGAEALTFSAPRIAGDTVIRYLFSAYSGDSVKSRQVTVKVKEAIPDPSFGIPAAAAWDGAAPLVIRATLDNRPQLDLAPGHPLRYRWFLEPLAADLIPGGDSLVLSNPSMTGPMLVVLCMDNGGPQSCDSTRVQVSRLPVAAARQAGTLPGGLRLAGSRLSWTAPGRVRVWSPGGRLLFDAEREAGGHVEIPEAVRRHWRRSLVRFSAQIRTK